MPIRICYRVLLTAAFAAMAALPAAAASAVPFETRALAGSNAALYAMRDDRLPRVWYDVYLDAGERYVPADRAGMSTLAAETLDRGPAAMPYDAYRRELFRAGIELDWEATNRFLIAHVKCRPEQLATATRLVRDAATDPRLDVATFTLLKDRALTQRQAMDDDMRSVTFAYGKQKLWDFRPEVRQPEGWAETLGAVTREDMRAYMNRRLAHPGAYVAAAGPLTPRAMGDRLAPAFKGWATRFVPGVTPAPAVAPVRRVILIDKPGATDNQIYMLTPFSGALAGRDAAAAEVFLAGMGYGLGARLGKALRVERGLTYHASSGLRRVAWPSWYVYSFGANSKAPQIVSGVFELFEAARGGLTDAEVAQAKEQLLKADATALETPADQMMAVAAAVSQGLPASDPYDRPARLKAVTAAEVRQQAAALAAMKGATLVLMGDASQVQKPITAALPAGTELSVVRLTDLAKDAQTPTEPPKP